MIFSEAFRSLRASASTTVAATMTVLIAMFLMGVSIALGTWALSWSNHVKGGLVDKIYFADDATPAQINAVRAKLLSNPMVKSVRFISKQEALKDMRRRFPELFKTALPSNPLPASEEVTPKKGEYTEAIARTLVPRPAGVDKVSYGKKTAHRILTVTKWITMVVLIAVVILLAASLRRATRG
jgi:cell division transport system permease protein